MLRAKAEGAVPPGGWSYIQTDPGLGEIKISAPGKDSLISSVTQYRITNNILLGNPLDDIDNFVCGQWPHYCGVQQEAVPYVQEYPEPRNFRERVTNFLANRYQHAGSISLVDEQVAESRAEICTTCPQNQDFRVGCPPCVANADRQSVMIRQARSTKAPVMGCMITAQDNRAAVHLPEKLLRHRNRYKEQLEAEAPHCWLLKLE